MPRQVIAKADDIDATVRSVLPDPTVTYTRFVAAGALDPDSAEYVFVDEAKPKYDVGVPTDDDTDVLTGQGVFPITIAEEDEAVLKGGGLRGTPSANYRLIHEDGVLTVSDGTVPYITNLKEGEVITVAKGRSFEFKVDADGAQPIRWGFSGPEGLSIDSDGLLSGMPNEFGSIT